MNQKVQSNETKTIAPLDCSCGGKPKGRGALLICSNESRCHRIVQMPSRAMAVERWNEAVRRDKAICTYSAAQV